MKKNETGGRRIVISVLNTVVNSENASTDSTVVNNTLFNITVLDYIFLNAQSLLSTMYVLREYAVKKITHYRKSRKLFRK